MNHSNLFRIAVLLSLIICTAITALSHDFVVGGIYYNIKGNEAIVTYVGRDTPTDYNDAGYSGDVIIPDKVTYFGKRFTVTSIGDLAFACCKNLKSVTIPNSITSINYCAFLGCSGLESITIPNSIIYIGESAFEHCTSLASISIPNSVTTIGRYAFSETAWYDNHPDGVVYAGKVAVGYKGTMPMGTSITIEEGTIEIAANAFYHCTNLTSIKLPNSLAGIGYNAFTGCSNLTDVELPNSVPIFNVGGLGGTPWFNNWYNNQPDGVLYFGQSANGYKGSMPSNSCITLKPGTTSISEDAFSCCYNLKTIVIPNSVKTIGAGAFQYCRGLTSISIPNSVTSIGENAFYECENLDSVSIPNSVTSIGDGTFYFCPNMTYLAMGDSVKTIGDQAFSYCIGLKSLKLPNSVTHIGYRAFMGLSEPTNLDIPNSVISINSYAFYGWTNLTSITIPNSVVVIRRNAFAGCDSLTTATIGNSVGLIENAVFPKSVKILYWNAINGAFQYGTGTDTDVSPFYRCKNLTHIYIGSEVESIGDFTLRIEDQTNIDTVTCYALVPPDISEYCFFFQYATYKNVILCVPKKSEQLYRNAEGWKLFQNIVGIDVPDGPVQPGDVNGDGQMNIDDVTKLIDLLLRGVTDIIELHPGADVDGDGKVNIDDVTTLITILLTQ